MARTLNCRLTLLAVVDSGRISKAVRLRSLESSAAGEFEKEWTENARKNVEFLAKKAREKGVPVETGLLVGQPMEELARRMSADTAEKKWIVIEPEREEGQLKFSPLEEKILGRKWDVLVPAGRSPTASD